MKKYNFLGILLTACVFAGCTSTQPTAPANTTNTTNTQNTATSTTPAANATPGSATTDSAAMSPTEVFKSQNEAREKKHAATLKQNLSRASLALVEKSAKEDKMTVDEWLTVEEENDEPASKFQTRNEKIDGDNATIEISVDGEDWAEMPFVKEDGRWKIALDKYMADLEKEFEENTEPMNDEPENAKPEATQPKK